MKFKKKKSKQSLLGFTLQYVPDDCPNCTLSEKPKEDDYDDIPDDPSVPVSMEVDQVTLVGEAGRSSGEVNTTSVKTILTQDEPQTVDFLYKSSISVPPTLKLFSPRNSELLFGLLFVKLCKSPAFERMC